jgi:hypothetical protein
MHTIDFRPYAEDVLALLEQHIPAWHAAIEAERTRRAEQQRIWNSASLLAKQYKTAREWRLLVGYSENEAARGFDDWESEQHHQMWKRIRFLRKRSLRRMHRRQRSRHTQ